MVAFDIEFEWAVHNAGYDLVRSWSANRQLDRIQAKGTTVQRTWPLAKFPALYRELASTPTSVEGALNFANRFGYLGLARQGPEPSAPPWLEKDDKGEPIGHWIGAIEKLRHLVDAQAKGDFALGPKEVMELGQIAVNLVGGADGRPRLALQPRSLYDAILLQFSQALVSGQNVNQCRFCGCWFEVGGRTGRRSDAKYCCPEHKDAFHNRAKAKKEASHDK